MKSTVSLLKGRMSAFLALLPQTYHTLVEAEIDETLSVPGLDGMSREQMIFVAGHLNCINMILRLLEPKVETPKEVAPRFSRALDIVKSGNREAWAELPEKIKTFLIHHNFVAFVDGVETITPSGLAVLQASAAPSKILTQNQISNLQAAMDHDIEQWSLPGQGRAVGTLLKGGYVIIKGGFPILTEKGKQLASEYDIEKSDRYKDLPEEITSADPVNVDKRVVWTGNQKAAFQAAINPDKSVWFTIAKKTRDAMVRTGWVHMIGEEIAPTPLGIAMASMNGIRMPETMPPIPPPTNSEAGIELN